MREATEDLLNSSGFRTRCFSSAEEFLRSRDGRKAACLVLDLRLPGMSGLELQRQLRAKNCHIPTIFVTAEDDAAGVLQARLSQAGALAVLRKPLDPEELARVLRLALGAREVP